MKFYFSAAPKHPLVIKKEKKELAAVWSWPLLMLAFIGGAICGCILFVRDCFADLLFREGGK